MGAREFHTQQIHYLRKTITYEDGDAYVATVGTIPAGATIVKAISGVYVNVVTDFGTTNDVDIGVVGNNDLYATSLSTATLGFVPLDEAVSPTVSVDTVITAETDFTGTAASQGEVEVVIAYIPDNDG